MTEAESPNVPIDRVAMRRWRRLKGLNQGQLAAKADISYAYVGHIERGDRLHVSPAVFARICDALGVQDRAELLAAEQAAGR